MTKPLAVVTGGSAGISLELSRLLAKDGYDLFISGSSDRVNTASCELGREGADVTAVKSDLSTAEGTGVLLDAVKATDWF